MLSLISWKSFIEVLLVLLGAYYLLVFVLYYPRETWALLRVKKTTPQIQPDPVVGPGEAKKTENVDPPEFALTNQSRRSHVYVIILSISDLSTGF